MVTVPKSGPQRHFVRDGPTDSAIAARFQRLAGRPCELRRGAGGYFIARIQTPQMRHMPMTRLGFFVFLQPFQDAAIRTDARRREPRPLVHQLRSQISINPKDLGRFDAGGEQITHELLQHGRPHANRCIPPIGQLKVVFR